METKTVYFTIGPSGAGKSTWASKMGLPVVSRDIIREDLGFTKSGEKALLDKKEEDLVTLEHNNRVNNLVKLNKNFILDNTNTNLKFLTSEIQKMKDAGYITIGVFFKTPLSMCIQRRKGQVPAMAIIRMFKNMQNISPDLFDETIEVR